MFQGAVIKKKEDLCVLLIQTTQLQPAKKQSAGVKRHLLNDCDD